VVKAYVTDRLVHHVAPARWAVQVLKAQGAALDDAARITLPLLLLFGTEDQVADARYSEEVFSRAASADKTVLRYEGFYHECFNEVGREKVYADLAAWLAERAPAPPQA